MKSFILDAHKYLLEKKKDLLNQHKMLDFKEKSEFEPADQKRVKTNHLIPAI